MPAGLVFRGLAKGHRSLSEQRIIAAKPGRSTNNFNYFSVAGRAVPETKKEIAKLFLND
jgi:hypothetical protein